MDDHQLYNSLSFLWSSGIALVVVGLCSGWLLGCGYMRRQQAAAAASQDPDGLPAKASAVANAERSELLAVVNHEIRTPLNGVIGYTELLLETPLLSDQREFAMNVRQSAEVLVAMLNDISDYSRLQSGKLELVSTSFDFADALAEVMDLLASRANEKRLEFAHDITPQANLRVKGDPARARQVLLNLISNAIKFTAEGHVLVRVDVQPGAPGHLKCLISDTGCGITTESQTAIFSKPSITDAGIARRSGGPGVGLAISRRLVELMGGQIGVVSRLGKGSDFWFHLPLAADNPGTAAAPARPAVSDDSPRVLVVEPAIIGRQMLTTQLTSAGFMVEALTSGQESLARLRQLAAGGRPFQSVVFAEKLPDLPGRNFAQAIRTDPVLRSTGLVCLRPPGTRSAANGMSGLGVVELAKPVLRATPLVNAVRTAPSLQPTAGIATAGPGGETDQSSGSGTSVFSPVGFALLAEDNELNQRVLVEMLRRIGWACKVADNGTEAVRLANIRRYDVILMDCHLPELSGFDATRQIRQTESATRAARTPIVAVTADAVADSRDRCLASGMDDCLTKPFRRSELEAMLVRWAPRGRAVTAPAA